MPTPGENIVVAGRFRLNRKLGQGGMGSVWHATQLGLDAPCAIKFIEGEFAALPDMQARFEREAKAAAALRSPHVVQIIDHSTWEGLPFIVMELLDGEDLAHRIERQRTLTPEETLFIVNQVCRALSKAHAIGIVHRDLKPENIYLVKDDDREIAKILDFGIAKNISLEVGSTTRTGAMLGTPFYMSPEQAQGTRAIDARSDLWAVAVIVYQCLTGQLPFESEALGDLLMKIMVAPAPIPSNVAAVPPGFDAWFQKATQREPAHRFQTAKELADTLAVALGSTAAPHSTMASIPDPREVRPPMPSEPRPFSGGAATMINHDADVLAAGVPKKPRGALIGLLAAAFLLVGAGVTLFVVKKNAAPVAPDGPGVGLVTSATAVTSAGTSTAIFVAPTAPPTASAGPSSPTPSASAAAMDPKKPNTGVATNAGTGTAVVVRPRPTAVGAATAPAVQSAAPAPTKPPNDLGF